MVSLELHKHIGRAKRSVLILDENGIKPSKEMSKYAELLERVEHWQGIYGREDVLDRALDSLVNGKEDDFAKLITADTISAKALEVLAEMHDIVSDDWASAVHVHVYKNVSALAEVFNAHAEKFTDAYRSGMNANITHQEIVERGLENEYRQMISCGRTMDQYAQTLSSYAGAPDTYGTLYGRNLAHAYALSVDKTLSYGALEELRRWVSILEAKARPGSQTYIRFDSEQAKTDTKLLEALHREWTGGSEGTGTSAHGFTQGKLDDFAARWWSEHK